MTIKKTPLCLAVTATLLSGCASTYQASPSYSEALNVIKAAGMDDGGFKDMPAPKDTSTRAGDSAGGALYNATMAYQTGGPGMTNAQAGLASLAISFISPGSLAKDARVIAWMPTTPAIADPNVTIVETLRDAGMSALKAGGYVYDSSKTKVYEKETAIGTAQVVTLWFHGGVPASDCTASKPCQLYFGAIQEPDIVDAPTGIRGATGKVYEWKRRATPFFGFVTEGKNVNEIKTLNELSKRLPGWIYLYIPPAKFTMSNSEKLQIPVMMHEGKQLYFVK